MSVVVAVVIGRNEGERLRTCLLSAFQQVPVVVYVDSGSVDGSVAMAQALGAHVENLDLAEPFTAARARNTGFRRALQVAPNVQFIQFIDGDCGLSPGWLEEARAFLVNRPQVGVTCGRLRERFPDATIYNKMCDMEWDTPVGQALACGGIALHRVVALVQVKGFRGDLIAGEEPELCVRLRANGWQVWRLDADMALHDAAMTSFGQWWKRSLRTGFAYAEGAYLHGAPPEQHWVRESRSAWFWGLGFPAALLLLGATWHVALWGFALYPLQVLRLFIKGDGARGPRIARAFFLVLGKFAEAAGQLWFWRYRLKGGPRRLIEYK